MRRQGDIYSSAKQRSSHAAETAGGRRRGEEKVRGEGGRVLEEENMPGAQSRSTEHLREA